MDITGEAGHGSAEERANEIVVLDNQDRRGVHAADPTRSFLKVRTDDEIVMTSALLQQLTQRDGTVGEHQTGLPGWRRARVGGQHI